jgi:hypothetical protein
MKKAVVVLAVILAAFPVFADDIAPPEWIFGAWRMEYEGEVMTLVFLENDMIMNGESVRTMLADGYVSSFRQAADGEFYSIRLAYADGFWWQETFPRPAMVSDYSDVSKNGETEKLLYQRSESRAAVFKNGDPALERLAGAFKKLDSKSKELALKFVSLLAEEN